MRDLATVLRKEILELLGNRGSLRGALVQAGVVVGICGVFVPWKEPSVFSSLVASSMLYLVFPSILASTVAADAFAGERERRTLETLLATPVSDAAVFGGKVAAAAGFAWSVALLALGTGALVLSSHGARPSGERLALLAFGALASSILVAAVATAVSLKMGAARSAQQVSSLLTMGLVIGSTFLLDLLPENLGAARVVLLDAALLLLGGAILSLVAARFGRDRLFDRR